MQAFDAYFDNAAAAALAVFDLDFEAVIAASGFISQVADLALAQLLLREPVTRVEFDAIKKQASLAWCVQHNEVELTGIVLDVGCRQHGSAENPFGAGLG